MRERRTTPQRQGWRKSSQRAAVAKMSDSDFGSRGRTRRQLLFRVSAFVSLAAALVLILMLILLREPERDVPLIIAAVSASSPRADRDPLSVPPNEFGLEDGRLMHAWFDESQNQNVRTVGRIEQQTGPMESAGNELIRRATTPLVDLVGGGPGGNLIALFLTARGLVREGQPYLLVGDSRRGDPSTWVKAEDLLAELVKQLTASNERMDKNDRLVVFLDAGRGAPQWDWGLFDHDFVEACRAVASRFPTDRVAVLLANGDGERSWTDPRRGNSLMATALVRSLTGGGDLDRDGVVTLGEIERSLQNQVGADARAVWNAFQKPVLLTSEAADWPVISQPTGADAPPTTARDLDALTQVTQSIDALWQRHHDLRERDGDASRIGGPLSTRPLIWSTLEKQLARLSQLAMAGEGYVAERQQVTASAEQLLSSLERAAESLAPRTSQLTELELIDALTTPDRVRASEVAFAKLWNDAKPEEREVLSLPPDIATEHAALSIVWPWLLQQRFDAGSLAAADGLLSRAGWGRDRPAQLWQTYWIRLLASPDLSFVSPAAADLMARSHADSRRAFWTSDLRASFWLHEPLASLDEQRMRAIDGILARPNSQSDQETLQRIVDDPSVSSYRSLIRVGNEISGALRLRDRLLHEVPRLAETLLADAGAFAEEESRGQSLELICQATAAAGCLGATLDLTSPQRPDDAPSIREIATKIRDLASTTERASVAAEALTLRLKSRVDQAVQNAAGDASGLRQLLALQIGSGVTDAEQRQRISGRMIELLRNDSLGIETRSSQDSATETLWRGEVALARVISGQHPLVYWLEQIETRTCDPVPPPTITAKPSSSATDAGDDYRRWIAEHPVSSYESALRSPRDRATQKQEAVVIRAPLALLDSDLRGRTFAWDDRPPSVEAVLDARVAADLQLLVQEHAWTTLREFWCEPRPGERAFFADAVERLQTIAPLGELPSYSRGQSLAERWQRCVDAATNPSTLRPTPPAKLAGGGLIRELRGQTVDFTADRPIALPEGRVGLMHDDVRESRTLPRDDLDRLVWPVALDDELSESKDSIVLSTFFRGIRRIGRLAIRRLNDPQVTQFRLPESPPPTVIVSAPPTRPERIVLVLDCSKSMQDFDRLAIARSALEDFLEALSERRAEVGLVFFGHRFGWVTKEDGNLMRESPTSDRFRVHENVGTRLENRRPIELDANVPENPNFDVEVIASVRPLADEHLSGMLDALQTTYPVGVTPTYQAISQAYDLLRETPGRVIVLTDGEPKLAELKSKPLQQTFRAEASRVQSRSPETRLTIVNFANTSDQLELKGSLKLDLVQAKDRDELTKVFAGFVGRNEVIWQRDGVAASRRGRFDERIAVDRWPPPGSASASVSSTGGQTSAPEQPVRPAEGYQIVATFAGPTSQPIVARADVLAEGGEAFDVQWADGALRHRPFNRDVHGVADLTVDGPLSSRYRVMSMPANLENNRELTIPLVIEASDRQSFTPKPRDVWIDLVGTDESRRRQVHYSVGWAEYQPGRPVPVLQCRVLGWPAWATRLRVEAHLKFDDGDLGLVELPVDRRGAIQLDAFPGIEFAVETDESSGFTLSITQLRRSNGTTGELELLPRPLPREAVTRRYVDEGIVERVFRYDGRPVGLRVDVISRSSIVERASVRAVGVVGVAD